jgi:hypothetical protein
VLDIIQRELELTMAFCGHTSVDTVDRSILLPGTFPTALQPSESAAAPLLRVEPVPLRA